MDEQHSGARTVVLHLLPGALITAFYAGTAPVVRSFGFPSLMAIFLAITFVLIPFELGYLIYQARKNGTTLGSVVLYRQPVRRGQKFGRRPGYRPSDELAPRVVQLSEAGHSQRQIAGDLGLPRPRSTRSSSGTDKG